MKKAFAMLMGAAAALVMGAFSAAASDMTLDTKSVSKDENGISFTINSNKLAASSFTDKTTLTVGCGDSKECPVKFTLSYWNTASEANNGIGEPATVEVAAKEYKDGKAVFTYEDIKAALGDTDLSLVYSMSVVSDNKDLKLDSFEAKDVYTAKEAAEKGLLHAIWIHAKTPKESSNWGQSMTVEVDQFDVSSMTSDSRAIALFTSDAPENVTSSPVEFILQSIDDHVSPKAKNGTVWGKVSATEFGNSFAMFLYENMVNSYGTEDFSCVSTVHVGDTGKNTVACTDLFILNCVTLAPYEPEKPADSSSEAPTTTAAVTAAAPAETSAPTETVTSASSASSEDGSSSSKIIIFIVIGIVAGVGLAVAVLFIILGRKSKETYDVNRHRFIKKK